MNQYVIKEDIGRVIFVVLCVVVYLSFVYFSRQGAYGQVKKVFDKQTQELKVGYSIKILKIEFIRLF